MEERIKEMKKKYAKIQQTVQRSERAARARSHVKRKVAEQRALQNDEATKPLENLKERGNKSWSSTVSQTDQHPLPDSDLKRTSQHDFRYTKSSVSFSLGDEINLVPKHLSERKSQQSDGTGVNQYVDLKKTDNPEMQSSSSIPKRVKSMNSEHDMKSIRLEQKDVLLSKEIMVVKESQESIGSGKSSQRSSESKPEKQRKKKQRRSRDMEYLAPSLKESMEFDSCGSSSHTWVDGIPYPAEYYIRRTRSMKWKQWSEENSDLSLPREVKDNIFRVSEKSSKDALQIVDEIKKAEHGSLVEDNLQSCLKEGKCNPSILSSDSDQSQSILQGSCRKSGSRKFIRKERKSCLLSSQEISRQMSCSSEVSMTESNVSSKFSSNSCQTIKSETIMCQSAGVSESAIQSGKRRSKLSRRKVKSCDNSPLDVQPKDSVNVAICKFTRNSANTLEFSVMDRIDKEQLIESPNKNQVQEPINSNQLLSTGQHPQSSSYNEHFPNHTIFPKYPHHIPSKSAIDFFLPDSEFVHLKVAKVRNTPVMARQSTNPSVLDIKNTSCKVLDLESGTSGECIKIVTQQKMAGETNLPEGTATKKEEEDGGTGIALTDYFSYKVSHSSTASKIDNHHTAIDSGTIEVSNTTALRPIAEESVSQRSSIVEDHHCIRSLDLLCSESSSALVSEVPSCTGEVESLITGPSDLNSEPLVFSLSDTDLTIQHEENVSCEENLPEEKFDVEIHNDNSTNMDVWNESDKDATCPGEELPTRDITNNSEVSSNIERERERTPVDLQMKDSIGSNVAQESPFSGVATGTPPRPAAIPVSQALCGTVWHCVALCGKADLLEEPAVQFTGCLSHDIDGRIICFDAVNCPQHESISSIVAVCFERSLVIWSEKIQDGCWEVEATLDLTQVESFENVCLVDINQNIWVTTGGEFSSSFLRIFDLNLDGNHTLQEHRITASDSYTRSQISTLCSVVNDGIAGASYECQVNRSTLFHIPLDIYDSDIATEVLEIGLYPGKVSSVHEISGTQHWIVGLSEDDVILGNLKFGQIVKCISWTTPFLEVPECLKASTEGGLLFMVLGCQDSRLDVVNPEAGRTSTLVEYTNKNEPLSRHTCAAADDQYLAMCFSDGSINIRSIYSGQVLVDIGQLFMEPVCVRLLESRATERTLLCVATQKCIHLHALRLLN